MAESEWYTLPDGREINIPADATRGQLDNLFSQLAQEYPTTIGTYYNSYMSAPEEEDGNIFGAALEGLKGIPKGYYGTMLSGLGGIAGVLTPGKDTAFERRIRKTQDNIQKLGRNDKYADSYLAKLGQGLGSGAAYWAGIGALRPLQMGKYVPEVVKGLSPKAGMSASNLASRLGMSSKGAATTGRFVKDTLDQAAMIAPFSVPIQWGQHASQVADYEERTGEDVSAAKELLGYGMTIPLALTEAIGIGALGGAAPGAFGQSAIKSGLATGAKVASRGVPAWKSFASGALEEAAQESVQTVGSAAVAQALYDDEALENLGDQVWEAATVGGGAGGVMALLLNAYTRKVGGNALNGDLKAAARILRDDIRNGGRTEDNKPGVPGIRRIKAMAGFGLANPNLNEEERLEQYEKRKEYHLDQIAIEQQVNVEQDPNYTILSPQELEQEAVLRVERDLVRDQRLYEESQAKEQETRTEVGVTFPELDDIGGIPIEDLVVLVENGEMTPEMFSDILTSDRLSSAGNDQREALREFVLRNSSAYNEYDAGFIASMILGNDPRLAEDAENSESLFGEGTAEEQWQRAREMLASYLPPELAVKLVGETTEPESRPATPEEREAFKAIGEQQRDVPEDAMGRVKTASGGGVLGTLVEHVGDLTHRMTHDMGGSGIAKMDLTEKINRTLGELLSNPESSIAGQMRSNARDRGVSLETLQADTDAALAEYAEAHRALPAYNEMQRLARDAAVAIGEKNFGEATRLLQELQTIVNSPTFHTDIYNIEVPGRVTAPRKNLTTSELNEMIEVASENIENFKKDKAYDDIYGFQGGVDIYEKAHILHQKRRAEWRERDGQLELRLYDEVEQDILAQVREDVLNTRWKKVKGRGGFISAIENLLEKKNIILPTTTAHGRKGWESENFKSLVKHITGSDTGRIRDLKVGQRKALYGHILNMPTFSTPTIVPDLSPRMYGPEHISNVVGRLAAIKDIDTAKGSSISYNELATDLVNENFTLESFNQLLRHLEQGKYIEVIGKGKSSRYRIVQNNRAHARGERFRSNAAAQATEDTGQRAERVRLDEAAEAQRNDTSVKLRGYIADIKQALEVYMKKRGLSESGIEYQLSADLDSAWDVILGEDGVIENPENMHGVPVKLDGPNARILLNLSAIDPREMSIEQIIQNFDTKIWKAFDDYGYYFQDEIESMDAQAKDKFVSKAIWEDYGMGSEYQDTTYDEFSRLIDPNATPGDARALFMEDLSKGRVDKAKTAGKVGHIKKGILGYLNSSIEAAQDSPLTDVLAIFHRAEKGTIGRRGPGMSALDPSGPLRNFVALYGVDPRHLSALKRAIASGDTQSEEKILNLLRDERDADIRQSDSPKSTWDQTIFDEAMYQRELEDAHPGFVPPLGKNASENAKESYHRLRRGEKPYVMSEARKRKFRKRVTFEPTKKLSSLLKKYGSPEVSGDDRLTSELVLDNIENMDPSQSKESFEATKEEIIKNRNIWKEALPATLGGKGDRPEMRHVKSAWKALRDRYAFRGIPIQDQQRLREQLDGLDARLATTAAIAGLHKRNNAMNTSQSTQELGAPEWRGSSVLDGYTGIKVFEEGEVTTEEMFTYLKFQRDREYTSLYMGALRFIAYENSLLRAKQLLEKAKQIQAQVEQRLQSVVEGALGQDKKGKPQSLEQLQNRIERAFRSNKVSNETAELMLLELQLAWNSSQQDNIAFFTRNSERRTWKPELGLSPEEQVADAKEVIREIENMAADETSLGGENIVKFAEAYHNYNKRYNLPYMLATEMISPEMAEFLEDQAYAPLFKDIGMMPAHPLGGDGTTKRVFGLEWKQLEQKAGSRFENALEVFTELEKVDIITNIQYSQMAMIRDAETNVTARRALNDSQRISQLGHGQQSLFLGTDRKNAGATVLRVMVNGQEQYHDMADPLLTESVMISGFHTPARWFKVMRLFGRLQRHMIVDFPAFILTNFVRDQGQLDQIFGGSTGSWTPWGPLLKGLRKASDPTALLRAKELGLVTGAGGAYRLVSDLAEGGSGTFGETLGLGRAEGAVRQATQKQLYKELMKDGFENLDVANMTQADWAAFLTVGYQNVQQLSESTARLQAADITLDRTDDTSQAMVDGLEVLNFGRHGRDPLINILTSVIPFMGGGITGLDTYLRGTFGATDAPGAHLVTRTPEEFDTDVAQGTMDRGIQVMGATLIYLMLVYGTDAYDEIDDTTKANKYIVPLPGGKVLTLPIGFATGSIWKAVPEMFFRSINEADYTVKDDVLPGVLEQAQNNLNFHVIPQAMRPMWQAIKNRNDYFDQPIVPLYMQELDPEFQRNDYTSDTAIGLSKLFQPFDFMPGVKELSSPMKMEFLIRQYFGMGGAYASLATDRVWRGVTGKNVVGTRYDFSPYSLLSGEGIENFPVFSEFLSDTRKGRRSQEIFYELKDEMDVYTQQVNELTDKNDLVELRKYMKENANIAEYDGILKAYNRYMTRWRNSRDQLLKNPNISNAEKRRLFNNMLEQRQKTLEGIADVSAGIKGVK